MKKIFYISIITLILGITFIEVKFNIINKVKSVSTNPKEAFYSFYQIIRKEGIVETFYILKNKLTYDLRLTGIGYSLKNKNSYPQVEDAVKRTSLPLYKIIKKIPTNEIRESLEQNYSNANWHRSHGGNSSAKYSILKQINKSNIKNLEIAWKYKSLGDPNIKINVETNPIIVGNRMFLPTIDNHLLSIDATTGVLIWKTKLPFLVARRGLTWEKNDNFSKSRLFVPTSKGVYAINAENGKILKEFGNNGQIGNQSSLIAPIVTKKSIIIALIKPAIEAYDKKTGKLLWSTSLIKKVKDGIFTGSVPWGGMSFDESREKIYVVTGNPRPGIIGIKRPGNNDFSNSVISINSNTGKITWSFQEVAHDLWDFDIASPPILASIEKDSKKIDVVVTTTKIGNTILLDRDYGRPIYNAKFKRAPTSKIPGEKTAPYQPSFDLPEMFTETTFRKNDVTNISEIQKKNILLKIKNSKYGFFETPSLEKKLTIFGLGGGAQWTGASFNPYNSTIFIPSVRIPWQVIVNYTDLKSSERDFSNIKGHNVYQLNCSSCHGLNREGKYVSNGEFFSNSLVGISFLKNKKTLTTIDEFKNKHQDILSDEYLKKINMSDVNDVQSYLSKIDHIIDKEESFGINGFWRKLVDNENCPGSKPPWLFLTAINLESGKIIWKYNDPTESYINKNNDDKISNGKNCKLLPKYGFTMTTAGKIVFGIFGKKIKAFDIENGDLLWSYNLDEGLSAPPSTYEVNGIQYLTFVSSFKSNNITTFKLK